ncbi:hypothetical protein Megpolyxen_01526 (plasmid) [Candidatus Megaera polyxenophila]|nr:hypothetical protein Megpolyxen_01526 [Candidatus Megaera polyxenophila]
MDLFNDRLQLVKSKASATEFNKDYLKWLRIEANTLKKTAEKAKREKGIAEGIEKTALNMLKQKLDDKLISSVTGLTLEEILKLKNKN